MTRRFVLILVSIAFSVPIHAQWLTKADESPSVRSERHNAPRVSEGVEHDAGIGDAFKWYWGQRTFGLGYIPKGALQAAEQQRDAMRQASGKGMTMQSIQQPPWTLVGPVNIGGRVNAIAINPYNPSTVFIGAANGGVWKTMDAGTTWTPLTDQLQSVSMGSLAIDPNDTNIVFAGTGELPVGIDSYSGYGLLRSTDGGTTWSDIGSSSVGAYSRVIVNPKHSNIVYAAAGRSDGGVLRSSDGGNSWNWLAGGLPAQGASVSDLALCMNGDNAVLYAGVVGHGVFQSMDGGDSWTELNPFPQIDTSTDMLRISLDVDPKNWQNVVALDVSSVSGTDDFGGLEVSNDGGNSWTDAGVQFENDGSPFEEPNGSAPPQGWYDVYIKVDPSNFNHMLFGGVEFASTVDGGGSWNFYQGGMHVDHHAAEFAPSDPTKLYVGCDGGVYFSSDGGSIFNGNTFPIPITQFYGIGIDQTKSDVTYGGTQDNGTLSGASGGSDWNQILGGDGTLTQVDPKTPSIVYCETPQSLPSVYPNGSGNSGLNASIDSTVWLDPFAADATNDIIYWGCQRLAYSKSQGASWTNCKQVFGSAAAGTTISSIDAFGDGKTVLVGTGGGIVYLTTNNGTSFTNVSANLPGRAVTWVKFNPSSKTTFYATTSGFGAGHVFKTTNSGMQWTNISSTLPDIPVNTLVMDPQNPTVLYIGTDVGVFFSPNDGGEWMPYGTGLPNTGVDFMEVHVGNRVIRAGTHGRSIWQVPLEDDVTGIVLPAQRTLWTLGDSATIQWHGFASPVSLELSEDGGTTWQNVAKGVQDTTYTVQNILYPPTENALVRVSDGTDSLLSPLFSIAQQKAGNQIATVGELPLYLYDIAYDKDDNVLWGTNFGATEGSTEDEIYKIDPDQGTLIDSVLVGPIINASSREGFTGIKYDPNTKHLFLQQVDGPASGPWSSDIYEVTTSGTVVGLPISSPAEYGTGIYVQGDTLLVADRMTQQISSAVLPLSANMNFTTALDFSDTRSATFGPRGLTYDPKLGEYLLAYTDFEGTIATATLQDSYLLFLNPDSTPVEQNAFTITVGEAVANVRGMEYDPRGAGNTAWMTVLSSGNAGQLIKIALTDGPSSAPEAVLSLQPSTVDFGKLDTGKTMTLPVEIHNTGTAADTITSISIVPSGSPFSLEGVTFPVIILPGDSITDSITFAPHSAGEPSATLTLTSNQDNPVATFQISGIATINGAGVAPAAVDSWGIELSPNPASDYVNVTLDAASAQDVQIRIFDVTGREVSAIPLGMLSMGEHETELSTTGIPSGIYFVRVIGTSGEVAAARLAIAR